MRMKSKILVAFGVLVALAAWPAAAQMASSVVATIPFGFTAGNADLPAGKYTIERAGPVGSVVIRNLEENDAVYLPVIPAQDKQREGKARLVFNKYGDQYFLTQVWTGNAQAGVHLRKSRRERETAAAGRAQQIVAVLVQ